jgi:uncharacterized protein (DUF58 family)
LQQILAIGQGIGNDSDHYRREGTGEFRGLREFSHGDPVKLIHWPLSARFQNLVVKEYDPVAPEELIIVFHSYWQGTSATMTSPEYALQLLAGMFALLHDNGTEFSFYSSFNSWDEVRVNDDPETMEGAFESLARADITPLSSLEPLTDLMDELPEDDRRVVIFSNTPKKHWQQHLGENHSLICLDCKLELDLQHLSQASRERKLQAVGSIE